MDLCWLKAFSAFILYAIFKYHVPLIFVLFIYCMGIITNRFCFSRQRMRIQVFAVKLVAFPASVLMATHYFLFQHNHNAFPLSLSQLFICQKTFVEWGLPFMIILLAGVIWKRSTIHVVKPLNLENVYHRLDLGIAMLLGLMIVKLLLFAKFGIIIVYPDLKYLFVPFFLFGLLTIGLMLSTEKKSRFYAPGFQKIGVALSFAVVMLSGGLALVFLFHSQLIASAVAVSGVLKKAGPPLEGAIVWLARLLWSRRRNDELPASSMPDIQNSHGNLRDGSMETGWLMEVVKWGAIAMGVLVLLVALYFLIRYLVGFLFGKTGSRNFKDSEPFNLWEWINRLKLFMSRLFNRIAVLTKGIDSATALFKALVSWGRRSGIPYQMSDTPREYGARLTASFPALETQIETIVHLVYQAVYGGKALNSHQISEGKKAKRKMTHPKFWKDRIKTWVLSPKN
jgi:uncharacterized protein DUF4129